MSDEYRNKKSGHLSVDEWTTELRTDIPNQHNKLDCGVFMLLNADCVMREAELDFTEEDMPNLRKRIVLNLLCGEKVEG